MPQLLVHLMEADGGNFPDRGYYAMPDGVPGNAYLITAADEPIAAAQTATMQAYTDSLAGNQEALEFLTQNAAEGVPEGAIQAIYNMLYVDCAGMSAAGIPILDADDGPVEDNFGADLADAAEAALM